MFFAMFWWRSNLVHILKLISVPYNMHFGQHPHCSITRCPKNGTKKGWLSKVLVSSSQWENKSTFVERLHFNFERSFYKSWWHNKKIHQCLLLIFLLENILPTNLNHRSNTSTVVIMDIPTHSPKQPPIWQSKSVIVYRRICSLTVVMSLFA